MLFATALTNDSIADALARPEYRELYIALAREILAVAAAHGVRPESFDGFDPAAYLPGRSCRRRVAIARSRSSRTIASRPRPTAASGATSRSASGPPRSTRSSASSCALGAEAGVPTPLTARGGRADPRDRARRIRSAAHCDNLRRRSRRESRLHRPHRHRHRRRARIRPRDLASRSPRAAPPCGRAT